MHSDAAAKPAWRQRHGSPFVIDLSTLTTVEPHAKTVLSPIYREGAAEGRK
ncbi:hypothetical protein [Mycolicibacterium hassiacum]|uniref:hypothetical protein n=1 Tax=Mycolicibacterium hassiacum TaxID=46351 RepID=UPI0013A55415|nr:hypothetical protein [Mycolicibacterium hassiacum]MBX5488514.1 hypothetical protein [Mycolicibacterium hassiacum]